MGIKMLINCEIYELLTICVITCNDKYQDKNAILQNDFLYQHKIFLWHADWIDYLILIKKLIKIAKGSVMFTSIETYYAVCKLMKIRIKRRDRI